MYCSGCGQVVSPGQPVCAHCGRPTAPPIPVVPGLPFQIESYAGKIKALSVCWFVFAVYSVLTGIAGMTFAHAFFFNHFGPWGHGPWNDDNGAQQWFGHAMFGFMWISIVFRAASAIIVAWGLHDRAQWGRVVAIVVAFISLLHPILGTALGIWTLVVLLGYRNSTLYDQLA